MPLQFQPDYDLGYADGYGSGYASGFEYGESRGRKTGTSEGKANGFSDGWDETYYPAFERGYNERYALAKTYGRAFGYAYGNDVGFEEGVEAFNSHASNWGVQYVTPKGVVLVTGYADTSPRIDGNTGTPRYGSGVEISSGIRITYGGVYITDGSIFAYKPEPPTEDELRQRYYGEGRRDGHSDGREAGDAAGYEDGYQAVYANAYEGGLERGREKGALTGIIRGRSKGYQTGWMNGADEGEAQGFEEGYRAGYLAMWEHATQLTGNLAFATASPVVPAYRGSYAPVVSEAFAALVPEPASVFLLATGSLLVGRLRRSRVA